MTSMQFAEGGPPINRNHYGAPPFQLPIMRVCLYFCLSVCERARVPACECVPGGVIGVANRPSPPFHQAFVYDVSDLPPGRRRRRRTPGAAKVRLGTPI